jgi:ATP-binding cassette subfamily B protein
MHADQILFVENGRIVERGTHQQLLVMGGRYRALYDLQLRPEDERPHDPGAMAAGVA